MRRLCRVERKTVIGRRCWPTRQQQQQRSQLHDVSGPTYASLHHSPFARSASKIYTGPRVRKQMSEKGGCVVFFAGGCRGNDSNERQVSERHVRPKASQKKQEKLAVTNRSRVSIRCRPCKIFPHIEHRAKFGRCFSYCVRACTGGPPKL